MGRIERIFAGLMCATIMCAPAVTHAATSNGCDNPVNTRINSGLALCSTHMYNIGEIENSSNETQRQLMREVIALKTTVMTQQMYKQYEYLDAMIRRMKTQLEKAILTTKLQAAGAESDGSMNGNAGGNYSSGYGNAGSGQSIASAENCIVQASVSNVMDCLQRNIVKIQDAINAGNVTQARKQLDNDVSTFNSWAGKYGDQIDKNCTKSENCCGLSRADKKALERCINHFRPQIANAKVEYDRATRTAAK